MSRFYSLLLLLCGALMLNLSTHAQVSVTATAGTAGPTSYTTLKAAFDAVNAGTHKGNVQVTISASTTETAAAILNSSGTGGSSYTSLLVRPAAGTNPVITSTSNVAAIQLKGADNVTIDGSNSVGDSTRNLTIINNAVDTIPVVWITSAGAADGATGNTIRSCIIKGNSSFGKYGIMAGSGIYMGDYADAPNNANSIVNNAISKLQYGIYIAGSSGYDQGWVIRGNDLGSTLASDKIGYVGMLLVNSNNFIIQKNKIAGVESPDEGTASGIVLYDNTNGQVTQNRISDIKNTEPTGYGANGIMLAGIPTSAGILVDNNFIWDIAGEGYALKGEEDNGYGIVVTDGGGYRIFYNTIVMNTTQPNTAGFPAAFNVTSGVSAIGAIELKNNIFVNTATAGTNRYAIISTAPASVFSSIDHNDYYSSGSALGFISVSRTNLAAIQAGFGGNANSVSVLPVFVSTSDLHLVAGSNNGLDSKGIAVAVSIDIDNQARSITPDLGADEMPAGADVNAPMISYSPLGFTCAQADRVLTATIVDASGVPVSGALVPRIYYKKSTGGSWYSKPGSLTGGDASNGSWSFTIAAADLGILAPGETVQYYLIAQDVAGTPNISSRPAGAVATNVNTVTTHPSAPATYTISNSLSGNFTVGSGGNYPNLLAAITAFNNSCITGPVTFNLTDAAYNEAGPMVIEKNPYSSATNTLTIKPAAGITANVTASTPGALLTIRASYVTIEGSNSGGTSRNLLLSNSDSTAISIVQVQSVDAVTGVRYVTVRNTTISGANNGTNVVGLLVSDSSDSGFNLAGIVSNISIRNNLMRRTYFGIVAGALSQSGNGEAVSIANNDLSSTGTNSIHNLGIYVEGLSNSELVGNTIGNFESNSDEGDIGIFIGDMRGNNAVTGNTISALNYTGPDSLSNAPIGILVVNSIPLGTLTINDNTITNLSSRGEGEVSGIYIAGASSGIAITKNRISNINNTNAGGYGANGIHLASSSMVAKTDVVNNFIWDITGVGYSGATSDDNGYGIIVSDGSGYNIYFNTVSLNANQVVSSGRPAAFLVEDAASTGAINLVNNIFSNTQTVGTNRYAIYSAVPASVFASIDHNVYYSAGPNPGYRGSDLATLAALQTGLGGNMNSLVVQPQFVSYSDLHLTTNNQAIDNKGTSVPPGGYTDIDGTARHATTPDPGADEFTSVCAAPVIGTQPASQAACQNGSLTLGVTLSAGSSATYQWRKAGTNIPGATNSSYVIQNVTFSDAGNYDVVITNSCGNATSTQATITVNAAPVAGFNMPATLCTNTPVTFTNTSTATGALTYLWNLGNGTNSTTTNPTTTYTGVGTYMVTLKATANGCSDSIIRVMIVQRGVSIVSQPSNQSACAGGSATFSVVADSINRSYQWYKNGVLIPGATAATFTISNVVSNDAGNYSVTVTGNCGSVSSANASLTIGAAPAITAHPASVAVCAGRNLTLSVSASGSGLTYQWRKGGVAITGATSASYNVATANSSHAGSYDVVVGSNCGTSTVTSNQATVTINPATGITTQPQSQTVCVNGNASFSVVATGSNLTYQWFRNGVLIPGVNVNQYMIFNVAPANAGTYSVKVTGNCDSAISVGAVLTVSNTGSCATALPRLDTDVSGAVLLPNIVRSHTVLRLQSRRSTRIDLLITDASGRTVTQFSRTLHSGRNEIRIDTEGLAAGTYLVSGRTPAGRISLLRFIKQ